MFGQYKRIRNEFVGILTGKGCAEHTSFPGHTCKYKQQVPVDSPLTCTQCGEWGSAAYWPHHEVCSCQMAKYNSSCPMTRGFDLISKADHLRLGRLSYGGSLMRPEATGYGLVYFVQNMLEDKGDSLKVCPCCHEHGVNMSCVITLTKVAHIASACWPCR